LDLNCLCACFDFNTLLYRFMNVRKVEKLISSQKVSIIFFFSVMSSVVIVLDGKAVCAILQK
jgi:hypothetical protein